MGVVTNRLPVTRKVTRSPSEKKTLRLLWSTLPGRSVHRTYSFFSTSTRTWLALFRSSVTSSSAACTAQPGRPATACERHATRSHAEQGRAAQNKAEQGRTRSSKAEQGRARQNKVEQGGTRQNNAEQGRTRQNRAEQYRTTACQGGLLLQPLLPPPSPLCAQGLLLLPFLLLLLYLLFALSLSLSPSRPLRPARSQSITSFPPYSSASFDRARDGASNSAAVARARSASRTKQRAKTAEENTGAGVGTDRHALRWRAEARKGVGKFFWREKVWQHSLYV